MHLESSSPAASPTGRGRWAGRARPTMLDAVVFEAGVLNQAWASAAAGPDRPRHSQSDDTVSIARAFLCTRSARGARDARPAITGATRTSCPRCGCPCGCPRAL